MVVLLRVVRHGGACRCFSRSSIFVEVTAVENSQPIASPSLVVLF